MAGQAGADAGIVEEHRGHSEGHGHLCAGEPYAGLVTEAVGGRVSWFALGCHGRAMVERLPHPNPDAESSYYTERQTCLADNTLVAQGDDDPLATEGVHQIEARPNLPGAVVVLPERGEPQIERGDTDVGVSHGQVLDNARTSEEVTSGEQNGSDVAALGRLDCAGGEGNVQLGASSVGHVEVRRGEDGGITLNGEDVLDEPAPLAGAAGKADQIKRSIRGVGDGAWGEALVGQALRHWLDEHVDTCRSGLFHDGGLAPDVAGFHPDSINVGRMASEVVLDLPMVLAAKAVLDAHDPSFLDLRQGGPSSMPYP
jgi:hypothetical protein